MKTNTCTHWLAAIGVGVMLVIACAWMVVAAFQSHIEESPSWIFEVEYPVGISVTGRGGKGGVRYSRVSASTYSEVPQPIPLAVVVEGYTLEVGKTTAIDDINVPFHTEDSPVRDGWRDFRLRSPQHSVSGSIDENGVVRRLTFVHRETWIADTDVQHMQLRTGQHEIEWPLTDDRMRDAFGEPSSRGWLFSDGP